MTDEEKPTPEGQIPTQTFAPGTAEALADVFRDMITNLGTLRSGTQKASEAFIAYMDRVILLAGGTLTLIFTVLGIVSAHLHEAQQRVSHIPFVLAACWLLVAAITAGLLYNSVAIRLGQHLDQQHALTMVDIQLKLRLLSLPHVSDVSKVTAVPSLLDAVSLDKKIKYRSNLARFLGSVAQGALLLAFLFLVLFIQANILIMLDVSK